MVLSVSRQEIVERFIELIEDGAVTPIIDNGKLTGIEIRDGFKTRLVPIPGSG